MATIFVIITVIMGVPLWDWGLQQPNRKPAQSDHAAITPNNGFIGRKMC